MNIPRNPTPPPIQPAQSVLVFDGSFYVIIFRRRRYFRRFYALKTKQKIRNKSVGKHLKKKQTTKTRRRDIGGSLLR